MSELLKDPQDLSREELIAVLLKYLYVIYDSGGISSGRSLKSGLLEPARTLFRQKAGDVDFQYGNEYLQFVSKDVFLPRQILLFTSHAPTEMLDSQLVSILLEELLLHYIYEVHPEESILERKIVFNICRLLPLSGNFRLSSAISQGNRLCAIKEAEHRQRIIFQAASKDYHMVLLDTFQDRDELKQIVFSLEPQ